MSDTAGGDHSYRNRCVSIELPLEKIIDTVSDAGERIVKANRSIRAQELSVVARANVDMVPAPVRKNNRCVSAKRSFSLELCLALPAEAP